MPTEITLNAFFAHTIPLSEWNHRAHLTVAYLLLRDLPRAAAIEQMRAGVQAYNAAHQIAQTPTGGYHDTLTIFWMRLVGVLIDTYGPGDPPTADAFLDHHTQLHSKVLPRLYYTRERIMSDAARCGWVEPDLAPLPGAPGMQFDAGSGLRVASFAVVVRDYDEAIAFFVDKLGFQLVEDTPQVGGKRWVRVAPRGNTSGATILLSRAVTPEQASIIGCQAGGRVLVFLETDDLVRDFAEFQRRGVEFSEPPRREAYGNVAVFLDLYGNRWDLIEPRRADR